jgi:hypothetical protein
VRERESEILTDDWKSMHFESKKTQKKTTFSHFFFTLFLSFFFFFFFFFSLSLSLS